MDLTSCRVSTKIILTAYDDILGKRQTSKHYSCINTSLLFGGVYSAIKY